MQPNLATATSPYENIPQWLREYKHWICWRYQITPFGKTKVPINPMTGRFASTDDPTTWATFEQACEVAYQCEGIGFVFAKNIRVTGVDFDNPFTIKNSNGPTITLQPGDIDYEKAATLKADHERIISFAQGYVERSPSGTGYHLIVRGSVKRGVKSERYKLEMYDDRRFFTFTGDVVKDTPEQDTQAMLDYIYDDVLKVKDVVLTDIRDGIEVEDDEAVYSRALAAANGDKFNQLFTGDWTGAGYQSQSEADFALINIIAFYTNNFAQTRRLFLKSQLGKRDKAINHATYTQGMIERAQDKKAPPLAQIVEFGSDFTKALAAQQAREMAERGPQVAAYEPEAMGSGTEVAALPAQPIATPEASDARGPTQEPPQGSGNTFRVPTATHQWVENPPPGLMLDVATFIYGQARLPVREMALGAALAFMGGIAGRAFNFHGAGLNVFLSVLARTGRGKEGMSNGIDKLIGAMRMNSPAASRIKGPDTISSGQALIPYLAHTSNCFVSVLSEFDKIIKSLAAPNRSSAIEALEGNLLKLYSKSGNGDTFGTVAYADKAKNTEVLYAPSVTLLGECTIKHMKETISEGMISNGMIPRFVNIIYEGVRVDDNENQITTPPPELVSKLVSLFNVCMQLNQVNRVLQVTVSEDAKVYLAGLNKYCIARLNTKVETDFDDLWNRVNLNIRKLAALASIKPDASGATFSAHVDIEHCRWAAQIVFASTKWWQKSFSLHEIGEQTNDVAQLRDARRMIRRFFTYTPEQQAKYMASPLMVTDKIVTGRYLISSLSNMKSFKTDKRGSTNAIRNALNTLTANEEIYDMTKASRNEYLARYSTNQAAWKVLSLSEDDHSGDG